MTDTRTRRARVLGGCGKVTLAQVQAYMPTPGNYSAREDANGIMIEGADYCGWTMDGYVLPRLSSALIVAQEVVSCCPDPVMRGGRCDNCGTWGEDMRKEG